MYSGSVVVVPAGQWSASIIIIIINEKINVTFSPKTARTRSTNMLGGLVVNVVQLTLISSMKKCSMSVCYVHVVY